jgi:DNA-binding transcriptional regulator YdaS (Cro superfamily)
MTPLPRPRRHRPRHSHLDCGDEGMGLLLVIISSAVIMTLVLVAAAMALRSQTSARQHTSFDAALVTAEQGIDLGLARIQGAYDLDGSAYLSPHPTPTTFDPTPNCVGPSITFPASAGTSNLTERTWARTQLMAITSLPGCLRASPNGQYALLTPSGRQTVYSIGFAPSLASYLAGTGRARLLKSEYIFGPYKPNNAVLTGGDLQIDSSTTVTTAPGADPTLAAVHSDGTITVANGNPTVTGPVSQSGTGALPSSNNFDGTATLSSPQTIPIISAAQIYGRNVANYLGNWYDLCPDGTVHAGATTGPCTGTLIGSYGPGGANAGGTFANGWTYDNTTAPITWRVTGGFNNGVYYISQGNVAMGSGVGNPAVARATIIASAVSTTCNKVGGNIDWNRVNINAPYIDNTFMIADQDLRTGSNFSAGSASAGTVVSGLFIAGDQVQLETSSSGAYGSIIAADQCNPTGSLVDTNIIKNPSVYFDPNGYAPFIDVINTTLWLEFVG